MCGDYAVPETLPVHTAPRARDRGDGASPPPDSRTKSWLGVGRVESSQNGPAASSLEIPESPAKKGKINPSFSPTEPASPGGPCWRWAASPCRPPTRRPTQHLEQASTRTGGISVRLPSCRGSFV
uniref:Uncharacterized protein n=1 Tax=Arundo donax TaxID=35708 RepID=A0A0A9A6L6_ARUDO